MRTTLLSKTSIQEVLNSYLIDADNSDREQRRTILNTKCAVDLIDKITSLESSMNNNATSSQSLATKVFWLNIILAFATVAGVTITILQFCKNCP
jgi:hypothetical protein